MNGTNIHQRSGRAWIVAIILVVAITVIALLVVRGYIQSSSRNANTIPGDISRNLANTPVFALTTVRFTATAIGNPPRQNSAIAHVEAADLDQDGLLDVIVCDGTINAITWIRQSPPGTFTETILAPNILAPAHTQTIDIDGDNDLDILVASLGSLPPSNDRIGSVMILENDGEQRFTPHIIAEKVARVADVRGCDLDGDGDMDLAVAQFGADDGETCWMENFGKNGNAWTFRPHTLQGLNGTINVEPVDIDGDGDLDLVTIVSQEWEEMYIFENNGAADFSPRLIYKAANDDYGSSGISVVDLDADGDLDVLYTNGDAFDYTPPRPRPWHGVQWLEQTAPGQFTFRRMTDFPGAYSPRAADFDGDGDLDVIVVSGFNRWENPHARSLLWLEQTSARTFTPREVASSPTHLVTVAVGDFNGDNRPDAVTGGIHFYPPYDRLGRVTLWINSAPSQPAHP